MFEAPTVLSATTTIKARAYAEGVGPSAVSTALFSDGTIPLEPIELGEPVSRPGRDFNGSTVTVDFTGDIPEGTEPTAKITIGGVDYPGTVDAENGVATNLTVVAETASPVAVMVVMDCWAKKVSYSVDGMALGTYPMAEKATGVSTGFVPDETTWTSATDLLVGTGELEIAIGENETCAFYQIRESDKDPNP